MEINNLKSHLEVTDYHIQGTVSSVDRKNPPKLVPFRNDTCMLSNNGEDENSSPPHLFPEIIVTRTKLSQVTASPRQNADYDNINVAPEIEVIKSKLKANISSCTRTENVLSVSQLEGNDENRAPVLTVSANTLSNNVFNKNNANVSDEVHSEIKVMNTKQKITQLHVPMQKSPEVNSLVTNDVNLQIKAHDKSKAIRESAASLWDQSSCGNKGKSDEIVEIYNRKFTKRAENESKLVTEPKRIDNINYRKSRDASILISLSKEKRKSISEENVFSYPQCKLPKTLELNKTQSAGISSKSGGCIATNLNQNEHGSANNFNIQNEHYESATDCDLSNEQIAKSICTDLVNKVVKKCDYNKSNKCLYFKQRSSQWQSYCPSGNIWIAAHDEYKKSSQKVSVVKNQHIKACSMQSILKPKQITSKDSVPKYESATKSDVRLLCLEPDDLKLSIGNATSQNSKFSNKQSGTIERDNTNLAAVEITESDTSESVTEPASLKYSLCSSKVINGHDVNSVQFEAEKVGSCNTKFPSSAIEPQSSNNKDTMMTVDSFGRNLLLGYSTSGPGSMEASFSGGRSYVSSVPDYWSEIDDDEDEEEEDDKGDEFLNLKQRISTGKEERDTIDGVEFLAFETERDMVEFTKIEQDIQCNTCCDQGTNSDDGLDMMDDSFNSCGDHDASSIHQAIVPTKTKDITKIKGWRNKHFAVNNNPSHCINSNNSNGPYEDDDGFESLDVKIQDEVIVEEEPESFVEAKENRDLEDQQQTSVQSPVKTTVCCDDEVVILESKDDLLQTELNTDEKLKKAAFVSDEAEKFFSEFVSPEIAFDVPRFKPEETTESLPTSMRLSPRLQRLPPRKPITFWRKGLKSKILAEKKMLMAVKSNVDFSNGNKRKIGRPRKKKRGRPRLHPVASDLIHQRPKNMGKQLMSRRKFVSANSYDLDPDYKYTWVAGKPIRITGSKKQMLKKYEDKAQELESSHVKKCHTSESKMQAEEDLADKLDISGTADMKISRSAEIKENRKAIIKVQENKENIIEAIKPAEGFPLIGSIKPTSSLKMLEETKFTRNKAVTDRKLCTASLLKSSRNNSISEENKSSSYMKMTEQLEANRNPNLAKEKNSKASEQIKLNTTEHTTEQQNKEIREAANKLDVFKQTVEDLENNISQIMENAVQNTEKKEKDEQDLCNKNVSPLEPQLSLPKSKRTQMLINPCVGTPLHPLAIKTLMMVRSKNTLIDETWAKFAVSVVTSSTYLSKNTITKNSMPECRKSSFISCEEKYSDSSAKMKTRGIKAVNYKETTRIIGQSEALKQEAKIPIRGVVTRKRFAAMSESSRCMSVTNTDEEANEHEFSDIICTKSKINNAEETKKAPVTANSKQLATSTGTYSRALGHMLPQTSKNNEGVCSSLAGCQKISPVNETDSSSCVENECITSETNSKEGLNALRSSISDEKEFTVLKTAHDSTATSKRLAVLIEMCSKTAVCETNDIEKCKVAISSNSSTLNEASFSSDENLLDHKTNSSDSNIPSSPSSVSSIQTHSPLTTDSESDQAVSIIKEGKALFETRNEEQNGISLCCLVNSKETGHKLLDNVSVEKRYLISETNSEKGKSLKGHTTLNETSLGLSSDRSITSDITNEEIYGNANSVGNSKMPEKDTRESKSSSKTSRKRLYEVNNLFNKEDDNPSERYKIEENTALPSLKIVIRKLSTANREMHPEKKQRSKIVNSKRMNLDVASHTEEKDERTLSSNIGKDFVGTETLSGPVEKNTDDVLDSENSKLGISEDLDNEIRCILDDIINCVVCHEIQDLVIKDDPDGFSDSQLITPCSPRKYRKKTKLNRELSRLSANLIVMNEYEVEKDSAAANQVIINCKNDFCRLGCICSSLLGNDISALPDHCGKPSCMFECTCSERMMSQNDKALREEFGDKNRSSLYRTAVHLLDQGNRRLAKVEKEFSRTVIHSGKETVVVGGGSISDGGRRRREIKLPERYRDYNVAIGKEFAMAEFKMISTEAAFNTSSNDTYRALPNYVEVQVKQAAPTPIRKKPKPLKGKLTLDQKITLLCERYRIKACSVRLRRLVGMDDVVPWCMDHMKYDCFCRGSSRVYKKLRHSSLERPPPLYTSKKNVNGSTTEIPRAHKSRNKAIKSTTLNIHSHDVERYSARTRGAMMNYCLRNKSHYFKQRRADFEQQQRNTSDWNTMTNVAEIHKHHPLTSNPENALTGLLNFQNSLPIMEQTEFGSENVAQDENIGFGKIVSITTLRPEEFEKCGTFEEISETNAEDVIESENLKAAYNPGVIANVPDAEGLFEESGINTASVMADCTFSSSIATNTRDEQIASSICGTTGSVKDSCYARIAKLISMKKDEIQTLLRKGECSLNLSRYENCAIQVVRWPILCKKFRSGEVSIWVHKHGNTSKILITERELKPDMYSTNIRKYFYNKQTKLPPLIQAMMENLIMEENEDKKGVNEKNVDAYGLFYCDGENWELVGCMRKIADKTIKQEMESEMDYPEAENREWPKETELPEENVCKSVMNASHEDLQDNLNELTGIKKEYEPEEQSFIDERDRTLSDFDNYAQLSDYSSKNVNVVSETNCIYPPEVYNSDGASSGMEYLIQTQNIEADSNASNTALLNSGEDLTLSALLNKEDFPYETKSTKDCAYSPTEIVVFSNRNSSPLSDGMESITLSKLLNSEDFKPESKQSIEYELQLPKSSFPCRWYVFAIKTPFDVLRFYKRGRNISFKQIKEAIKIANRKNKTIRIPLDNEKNPLESDCPKFGTYAVPNIFSHFFIGPYGHNEEIGFYALKSYNGMLIDTHVTCAELNAENYGQGIQRNHGMWYYAVRKEDRANYMDTDLEKAVNPDIEKSIEQTLTARSLEPNYSIGVEAVRMQRATMGKEMEDSSCSSKRRQSVTMHSFDSVWNPHTEIEHRHLSTIHEEKEALRRFSADANEEEELDVMTPYDVSSMVQEMKDDMQRSTTKYTPQRSTAMQTFPDSSRSLVDSEGEFKRPSTPSPSLLHQSREVPKGPGKTAVSVKLVPSIPKLGFVSAFMYHNKRMQLMNPFADYREVRIFKNLSSLKRWLTCEVKCRVKCFPKDLKLRWRVKQASRSVKNCRTFNPKVLDGTYVLTEKGPVRMRKSRNGIDPVKNSKKVQLRRSFHYLKSTLEAGRERLKLSKLDIIQKALEEIKGLKKQKKQMQNKVQYLKQKRLNTFKQFCAQLRGFTTEEKRGAMICLKNVMRRQSIPIVHLDDDDDPDTEILESRCESRQSSFAAEGHHSSDESSIEGYLSNNEEDSDCIRPKEHSLSNNEVTADGTKDNVEDNIILISSGGDGEEESDERPLSKLLHNAETSEFSKHGTLTMNSKDLHKSMSLSHTLNTDVSAISLSVEKETKTSSEENLQQCGNVSQTDIDDKDSVSITIVTEDQPSQNVEETKNNNTDVITMTCITQDTEDERSVEITRSNNRDVVTMTYVTEENENKRCAEGLRSEKNRSVEIIRSNNREVVAMTYVTQDNENERSQEENGSLEDHNYDKSRVVTSTPGINEMQLLCTELLRGTPENDKNTQKEDEASGSNQENAIFMDLRSDREKNKVLSESATSSTKHAPMNKTKFGANQQFLINGVPVTTSSGGFCYMMPPLLGQRSSLSLAVGSKHAEQQMPLLKRVWVQENSVAQNGQKIKQTSSEPSQKVRIITAPEDWKGSIITTSAGLESKKNLNTAKVTYMNTTGNIQTSHKIGSKIVSVPVVPAVVLPNNNTTSKTGYHLLTRGSTNFKIVQKHRKVDIGFPLDSESSAVPKVSPQIGVRQPITIVPAASLCSVTDPRQQNAPDGTKQVIKLKSLTGIERPNKTSQLKSVLINGQKIFVQKAERTYPLLVASSTPSGRSSALLNSSPVFSTVLANKSNNSTDSNSLSDTPKSSNESNSSSCLNSAPKTLFVSSNNYSNVLKSEAVRTANRCSFPPVSSLQTGSKAVWIKRSLNKPLMLKLVKTKKSEPVSSESSSVQESSASSSGQESDAPLSIQGRSNSFEAVNLKRVESSSMSSNAEELFKGFDVSSSVSEIDSGSEANSCNLKSEVLSNNTSVSELSTKDKEPEIISNKSEVISNDTSISQLSTDDKEPEMVSDQCSDTPTDKVQDMCKSTKTKVAKCVTEETPNKSGTNKLKLAKVDSTEAKKDLKVREGVTTRRTREIALRTVGMTTRSSKTKKVKS